MTETTVRAALTGREHAEEVERLLDRQWSMLIGGQLRGSSSGETFESVDPFSLDPIAEVPNATVGDADEAGDRAEEAKAG